MGPFVEALTQTRATFLRRTAGSVTSSDPLQPLRRVLTPQEMPAELEPNYDARRQKVFDDEIDAWRGPGTTE